jgi:hypothetical protein
LWNYILIVNWSAHLFMEKGQKHTKKIKKIKNVEEKISKKIER